MTVTDCGGAGLLLGSLRMRRHWAPSWGKMPSLGGSGVCDRCHRVAVEPAWPFPEPMRRISAIPGGTAQNRGPGATRHGFWEAPETVVLRCGRPSPWGRAQEALSPCTPEPRGRWCSTVGKVQASGLGSHVAGAHVCSRQVCAGVEWSELETSQRPVREAAVMDTGMTVPHVP